MTSSAATTTSTRSTRTTAAGRACNLLHAERKTAGPKATERSPRATLPPGSGLLALPASCSCGTQGVRLRLPTADEGRTWGYAESRAMKPRVKWPIVLMYASTRAGTLLFVSVPVFILAGRYRAEPTAQGLCIGNVLPFLMALAVVLMPGWCRTVAERRMNIRTWPWRLWSLLWLVAFAAFALAWLY